MHTLTKNSLIKLYEIDDSLWLDETIKILRENRLNELDIQHLIEELESLSRNDKAKVARFLELIIIHLLLCEFWEAEYELNLNHWKTEIISFRSQLERLLTTNLRNYLESELIKIYEKALKYVQQKTEFKMDFPKNSPYTLEQLLDEDWYPDSK